ncbi:SpoIIE family protein phosphatase [Pectinatus sottacetonis]|uniref:SpoIIE family protein phosphatase n=1 Tax=Pectinatus sottacetonis TaxID=1002795 RepID=UPI0018C84342|nr:SpoIIE family protein phosphatase [Pectinatus sottacetonis]
MLKTICYISIRPYILNGNYSGDTGIIIKTKEYSFLALIDVLGKGFTASVVAQKVKTYLSENYTMPLPVLADNLHKFLQGTHGAVAALCRIDLSSAILSLVSIGNITTQIWHDTKKKLLPQEGIIGYQISTPKEQKIKLNNNDFFIIHSDGVMAHIDFSQAQYLLKNTRNPAAELIAHFGKDTDDASCIIARCIND